MKVSLLNGSTRFRDFTKKKKVIDPQEYEIGRNMHRIQGKQMVEKCMANVWFQNINIPVQSGMTFI